jgi:hypothetical protein
MQTASLIIALLSMWVWAGMCAWRGEPELHHVLLLSVGGTWGLALYLMNMGVWCCLDWLSARFSPPERS